MKWTDAYKKVKQGLCNNCTRSDCVQGSNRERYLFCAEMFLYIVENFELSEMDREDKGDTENEKNN